MNKLSSLLALGLISLTSCSTQRQFVKAEPKFYESKNADIIIRYYSESISRILKPLQMEGPFLTSFDRGAVLDLAKQQTGRELAVVVLLQFNASDRVKQSWLTPLTQMGYKRVVFLRAENGRKLDGLPILENPTELTEKPKAPAEQKDEHSDTAGG
jgi:hypothetical protein